MTDLSHDHIRLLSIIQSTPNIGGPDLRALAYRRKINVDQDVVANDDAYRKRLERMLNAIVNDSKYGVHLREISGRPKKWFFPQDIPLPLVNIDQTLSLVINLAYPLIQSVLPADEWSQLNAYRAQIESPSNAQSRVSHYSNKVAWYPEGYGARLTANVHSPVNDGLQAKINTALIEARCLDIEYEKRDGRDSKYAIEPLALVSRGHLVYLIAQLEVNKKIRHFLVSRIISVSIREQTFNYPNSFDLDSYLKSGAFESRNGQCPAQVRVKLRISDYLITYFLERIVGCKAGHQEGRNIVEFDAPESDEVSWWLLGFGSQIEVLEPETLRNTIRDRVVQMHQYYVSN